jgi:carbonic anhydrase
VLVSVSVCVCVWAGVTRKSISGQRLDKHIPVATVKHRKKKNRGTDRGDDLRVDSVRQEVSSVQESSIIRQS